MLMDNSESVLLACKAILQHKLAAYTSGNASCFRRDEGIVYIKPSGVHVDHLGVWSIVRVVAATGQVLSDRVKPSTDLASHLFIYRNLSNVNAIVHTHSPYATAFALHGIRIPCCLTEIADEFGGEIPCSRYASIGGEEIGREVVRLSGETRSSAFLLRQHGVITIGADMGSAVKAAIMCEHAAKCVWLAKSLHRAPIPDIPQEEIDKSYERYTTSYGQGT
jgi:L-ribulose-5-phosphate 4-epimerase